MSRIRLAIDRPADGLLVERAELLTGWIEGVDGSFALTASCEGRSLLLRPCWHPEARCRPGVRGFWGMLFVQELLDHARDGVATISLAWDGVPAETIALRISCAAEHLAREYPLNLVRYPVPAPPAPVVPRHTLVFPGLGAVGGASLNALFRRAVFERGWSVPVHFEANDPGLWNAARASDEPVPRWIDGHACYAAADDLGVPSARVTLLRDPIRRLVSVFGYNTLVHPYEFPFATFEAFVHSDIAVRYTQAAALLRSAGVAVPDGASGDALYAQAREVLRSYALVGITEAFEETIFLLCQLGGYDCIGMWWKTLSAPPISSSTTFPVPVQRRLDSVLATDRRLYDDATSRFAEVVRMHQLGDALERYKKDAAERRELPHIYKLVECLRWRMILTDAALRNLRSREH